ncbi:type VI secretion system protein TssA [Enterovibrio coralii]|uniref:Type VI secretion protein n=1 Tax=Enterovibrio coralii TaxID=294935 RepID=A0A135ID93_9GAMM|nr:type VI secretion system protein TssA [Enterovibrio coralii]KXF83446.1 type VI secretion protein [Enterovibrio coralii]
MDRSNYRARLLAPIDGIHRVGEMVDDDARLDFIEAQMMKIGSLAHGDVKWGEAESNAIVLLEQKTKDVKVLAHLLRCLQHKLTADKFLLSIQLLTDFIGEFWEECYPVPGTKGETIRKRFFTQIIQRKEASLQSADFSRITDTQNSEIETALNALKALVDDKNLPSDSLITVASQFKKLSSQIKTKEELDPQADKSVQTENITSEQTSVNDALVNFDCSTERAAKHTLLKAADFMTELEGGRSLSLRLRRFAIWFSITSPPESDHLMETPLMPVSAERISEYEDCLLSGADLALWRKVEQSLTVSPYWIDGHYLSYRIAAKLGKFDEAKAIAFEVKSFVERLPDLLELKFKGGMPFINESTRQWLSEGDNNPLAVQEERSWDNKRKEAFSLAEGGGLSDALLMLNTGLANAEEPRERFYWRLISAELMDHHELSAMAEQEYGTLLKQISSATLADWEPSLIKHLENIADSR